MEFIHSKENVTVSLLLIKYSSTAKYTYHLENKVLENPR